MDFHTARAGEPTGVWGLPALQAALDSGEVLATDLVWTYGFQDWKPLFEVANEIGITLPDAEEDVPPIPSPELESPKTIQTSPRLAAVVAPVTSSNRGFPWLRLGIGVIALSSVVAIALPAYKNYRERTLAEDLSAKGHGQNAAVLTAQTDATPSSNDAQPESNVAGVTAFPNRGTCEDKDNAEFDGPDSRCSKILLGKYGAYIKFSALSKHSDPDGNEWKSSEAYLTISSDAGTVKSYKYNDSEGDSSTIPAPLLVFEPLDLLLVRVLDFGEEESFDLIDLKSGNVSSLGNIDSPRFSPDSQRFIANEHEYGVEYPTAVSVYKVISGKAVKEIALGASDENRDWWPIDARWTSNASFEFIKGGEANTTWDDASQKPKSNGPRQVYALEDGKWQQQAAELPVSSQQAEQVKTGNDDVPIQTSGDGVDMNCLVATGTLKRWESGEQSRSLAAPAMVRTLRKAQQDACNSGAQSSGD